MPFELFGRADDDGPRRPYAGGALPDDAFGAVPMNGEIVMELPPESSSKGSSGSPGGQYRARLAGTPEEHEEQVLFAYRDDGGPVIARTLDRVQGLS